MRTKSAWGLLLAGAVAVACQSASQEPRPKAPPARSRTFTPPPAPVAPIAEPPLDDEPEASVVDPAEADISYAASHALRSSFHAPPASCALPLAPAATAPACSTPEDARALLKAALLDAAPVVGPEHPRCASPYTDQLAASRLREAFYRMDEKARRRLDRALRQLEGCAGLAPGLVRLLRAHARPECADALASGADSESQWPNATRWALAGLAVKARIERIDAALPRYRRGTLPAQTEQLLTSVITPWARAREAQLERAAELVAELPAGTYGRGVAELALAARFIAISNGIKRFQLDDVTARSKLARESSALREAFRARSVELSAVAAEAVPLVSDWLSIDEWGDSLAGCGLYSAHDVLLPPWSIAPKLDSERGWWMLLPSYVAAQLVSSERLTSEDFYALAVAGLAPSLRRSLAERAAVEPVAAQLAAHVRIRLTLRSFRAAQARAARRPAQVAEDVALGALSDVLAEGPDGLKTWADCEFPPHAERLLRLAREPHVSPLESALLGWNAQLFITAERYGNLMEMLSREPLRRQRTSADAAFDASNANPARWCRTGALLEDPCTCPRVSSL